ncbi:hypothetical protein [Serratia ureilytica]|uniref:hypothetical protein n=1 Tax=Serratia ureilytica TaxID=300181 RepID=UPI001D189CB8|nr:hypothetical protein [Serratia ureilytica]MCC4108686.1 hypothetical protein [Serratia ureilytica]
MRYQAIIIGFVSTLLAGCAGTLDKIQHSTLKAGFFSDSVERTRDCIETEVMRRHFYLEDDEPLPGGSKRFNLLQNGNEVANLDMSAVGSATQVNFFYDERDTTLAAEVAGVIQHCQKALG